MLSTIRVSSFIVPSFLHCLGGLKAEVLTGHAARDEEFTGGTLAPGEG